jgi:hypothetical protein
MIPSSVLASLSGNPIMLSRRITRRAIDFQRRRSIESGRATRKKKNIMVKDIQSQQIAASPNILDLNKYAS